MTVRLIYEFMDDEIMDYDHVSLTCVPAHDDMLGLGDTEMVVTHSPSNEQATQEISVAADSVQSILIHTQPLLSYTEGQVMDLSLMKVQLNYEFIDSVVLDWPNAALEADPDDGTLLLVVDHDGVTIEVTHTLSGLSDETSPLSVDDDYVTSVSVIQDPFKMSYLEGETLDLTGLEVDVTWEVAGIERLSWDDDNDVLSAEPVNGTVLTVASHDGEKIMVWHVTDETIADETGEIIVIKLHNLSISSTDGGSVIVPGEGEYSYADGLVIDLMVEAEEGYVFVKWTGDIDLIADANAMATTITMLGDYVITAVFAENITIIEVSAGEQPVVWGDVILSGNFSKNTNVTFIEYAGNPYPGELPVNALQKFIDIDIDDSESSVNWPINITWYYTEQDLIESGITEDQLLGLYFWNETSQEWTLYNDTGVNTTYDSDGYVGYVWATIWHLTPLVAGGDSEPPSPVIGLSVSDAKDGKLDLSWDEASDNVGVSHYRIYRDDDFLTNVTGTTYRDTGLVNGQTYTYQVSAVDTSGNEGERSIAVTGKPTASATGGGGGGGGFIPPEETTQPPVALATVDKHTGTPGEIFTFDASESDAYDDGLIVKHTWDFDDGTIISTNETTITHVFDSVGMYSVMLTVEDDNGETGSLDEPLMIEIIQANNPPEIIEVIPETTWTHKQTDVSFTMSAFDADVNDTLRFEIEWGDGNTLVSEYVASGELFETSYQWDSFGVYTVTVIAYDEHNASTAPVTTVMLVDVVVLDDINGWLIDTDSDGVFDVFKNLVTNVETVVEEQADGSYLIDSTNDGNWDHAYSEIDGLREYEEEAPDETPGFLLFLMLFGLFVCLIVWKKKKGKIGS